MPAPKIAAIVLAAGLSSRMSGGNKLLAEFGGKPLVRHAVEAALASTARPVIVVTGHEAGRVQAALTGLDVRFAHNPRYRDGLSTSLKAGIKAVPEDCTGALIMLGDMPDVRAELIDRLIAAFAPVDGRAICVAMRGKQRGNPVLWARRFFAEIETLTGDSGAKHLIAAHRALVCGIEAGDDAALHDVDTPAALDKLRRRRP